MQTIVGKSMCSLRREKEAYKAMSNHNHTGSIWSNVPHDGANRREGPGTHFEINKKLPAGTSLIVLCYTQSGDTQSWVAPGGHTYRSDAWDFVVTSDQDRGGYVADVLIDTGGEITHQLGTEGTCDALSRRLANPSDSSPG